MTSQKGIFAISVLVAAAATVAVVAGRTTDDPRHLLTGAVQSAITTAPSISDAAPAGNATIAETASVVAGRELAVLSSTEVPMVATNGSVVTLEANVVWVNNASGATNAIRLDAPATAVMMTSDTAGCALTWDGKTARLVRINDSTGSVLGTLDLPILNGAWISADQHRNCIAALNVAQGMDSSGVMLSDVFSAGVSFVGPFSLQGADGYMVGGSIATVLNETHDGGETWSMITTPKELFGAQYGQAWLDNGSVWLPYAQEVYSESSGDAYWTAGVLTRLANGDWTLTRASITASVNGFRMATSDGVITIADKDNVSSQAFDIATRQFRTPTTP